MLYDPKWEKPETKPDVFSLAGLIAWLETQPGETKYNWYRIRECLFCQYLDAVGVPRQYGIHPDMENIVGGSVEVYHQVGSSWPWTFGAALDRARKLASFPVQP